MEYSNSKATASSHRISRKSAENLCYTLIIVLNLSTWIDLNSVWIELPLIVNSAPEGWALPSLLALVISLSNVFPMIVVIFRWILGKHYSEIPFIYIIIIVGAVACLSIGLFWNYTAYIFGAKRSLALLIAVFALAILDCTSSLVFFDYMRRLKAKYLHALFIGESLTGTLPTFIALAQGVGGEAQCVMNNQTATVEPVYSQPRFSVAVFFFLVSGIIALSLVAFMILRMTSVIELAHASETVERENNPETCEMLLKSAETVPVTEKVSLSTPNSMTKKQFYILQTFNFLSSAILYGCLPSLTTYSLLPYGQKAFYYCTVLSPISYPLSALYGVWRPTLSIFWITIGCIFGYVICCFIIFAAFQSPCPIWADTVHGGIVMTVAWFTATFVLSYIRYASGNRIKLAWGKEDGLFNFGLSVQLGFVFGVVPMYVIINVLGLLKDRTPCVAYCL